MAAEIVKNLIDAGIHFGHRASRWNPKMKPYIYTKRNLIHVINVKETLKGLLAGKRFLAQTVAKGKDVLLVGTKRQARRTVQTQAERVGMHYVNDRWLGGTLTNFREIRKRIARLEELEKLEAEGQLDAYSKKEGSRLRREMRKIQRNLGGIRNMTRLPGALVVIDQRREIIAVREARKMKIPVICLLDTDSDPDLVDIPIPGNDDAMRAIEIIITELCDSVAEGLKGRSSQQDQDESQAAARRRSRRPTTARAEPAPQAEQSAEGESSEAAGDEAQPSDTPAAPAEANSKSEQS
ncbi:MAG: 30S ribosomal protein S2 [Phycisphaerae bacterium]